MYIVTFLRVKITNTDLKVWILQPGLSESQTEPERLRFLMACSRKQEAIQAHAYTHKQAV